MKYRSPLAWMVLILCIGTSFVLGRLSFPNSTPTYSAASAAQAPSPTPTDSEKVFLAAVHAAAEASPQPQLAPTVTALVGENAHQATQIAGLGNIISYVLTEVPAQDHGPTINALVYQHAQLSTEVAELYIALGSPVPTTQPTPTFGPSPTPSRTPFGPTPTQISKSAP